MSPSYARIEDNHDNAAEDEEELENTDEPQVRKRTSSSDLLKDEWYVEMFAPELHALEEARSVSKQRIEDVDTAAKMKTTPHSSKLDEHQRQVLSDFTKNMASGLVRVANEEREIPWDRDVREHDEKNFFLSAFTQNLSDTHRKIITHASNARETLTFYGDAIIAGCVDIFSALDVHRDPK